MFKHVFVKIVFVWKFACQCTPVYPSSWNMYIVVGSRDGHARPPTVSVCERVLRQIIYIVKKPIIIYVLKKQTLLVNVCGQHSEKLLC